MEGIEAPILGNLASKMPAQGNVITPGGSGNTPPTGGGELSPEEKLAAAEALIAKQEADRLAAQQNGGAGKGEGEGEGDEGDEGEGDEPTPEEIQSKLDELASKEEATLSDDEKAFIEKYTQEQLDEITSAKKQIEETYGLQLESQYDNSPEGLINLVKDAAPALAQSMFAEALEQIPYMKDFYNHIVKEGKGIETFLTKNAKPSFETIEFKALDGIEDEAIKTKMVGNYKQLIQLDLKGKGISEDDITTFVELYEAKGNLYDKAKEAKESLKARHQASVDAQLKAEEDRIKAEEAQTLETIKQVEKIIETNNYNGVQIPAADIKSFKEAMIKPVDEQGRTLMDYKRAKLTLEQRALIDYIVFKDLKNIALAKKDVSKAFSFSKAKNENNKRTPKLVNASNGQTPNITLKNVDFSKLKIGQ